MGGDRVDCRQNGLHRRDAAALGAAGRARPGQAAPAQVARSRRRSRRWSAKYGSCAKTTRSSARRRRILPRRSSTAGSSRDGAHRRTTGHVRSRADLQSAADRSADLLHARGPAGRSGAAAEPLVARPRPGGADPPDLEREQAGFRRTQGVEATMPRRLSGSGLHGGPAYKAAGPARGR